MLGFSRKIDVITVFVEKGPKEPGVSGRNFTIAVRVSGQTRKSPPVQARPAKKKSPFSPARGERK
jgi:hypothetical protein